ncbi:hypothetical protein ACOMHN_016101 [Nucella lapillus]
MPRDSDLQALCRRQTEGGEADDTLPRHTMPAASPLLNQFPSSGASDSEYPYRYPSTTSHHPDLPPHTLLPPSSSSSSSSSSSASSLGLKLPTDYDPFKFLSAMTEQCLTENFLTAQEHAHAHGPPQTCASAASMAAASSHFLLGPPPPPHPLYPAMTSSSPHMPSSSSPRPFYHNTSSPVYVEEGRRGQRGKEYGCVPRPNGVAYLQQPQQRMTSPCVSVGGGGERRGGDVEMETTTSKKGFFCLTEDLMETTDSNSLLSWTRQHPEHWTHSEVLDWLFYVAQERGMDMQDLRGEAFQTLTGRQLSHMTREDFSRLEPKYGGLLYQMFKTLLCGVTFSKPAPEQNPEQGEMTSQPHRPELSPYSAVSCDSPRDSPQPPTYHFFQAPPKPCLELAPPTEMYWKQERTEWKTEQSDPHPPSVLDLETYDFDLNDPPPLPQPRATEPFGPEYDLFSPSYPSSNPLRTSCFFPSYPDPPPLLRRRPGRPRVKSLPEDDRAKDKKTKIQHLWEFIYEVLLNPLYNPQYLRWENQREGVFRFVQSEAVAQLWGSRKNNENMTYEKLSRAMRHYYKRGILERVEGRRLVYKFSRKAMDRVRDKRHNSV